jgi:hypothetical protein
MSKLRIENNYWVTPNHILNNSDLSLKAKWLFWYIQSKPDGWDFSAERMAEDHKDGIESIYAWLKELENAWFLERIKYQDELWHWQIDYVLYINPYPVFSLPGKCLDNSKKEDSKKEANTSIDVLAKKTTQIEEKNPTEKPTKKISSSIRKGSKPIREIVVPPKKELVDQVLGQKRWVDKLYEIITLPNMKDYEVLALQDSQDPLSFTKLVSLYEWMLAFFQEKYDGKIYKDDNGKMVGSAIILNELDKFIAYYSEKRDEDILDIKARLRKWITNSLKYAG